MIYRSLLIVFSVSTLAQEKIQDLYAYRYTNQDLAQISQKCEKVTNQKLGNSFQCSVVHPLLILAIPKIGIVLDSGQELHTEKNIVHHLKIKTRFHQITW